MPDQLRIAFAQINPIVGDVQGNADKVRAARAEAAKQGADLVLFGELVLAGYPPEDLVLRAHFQQESMQISQELAEQRATGSILTA